MKTGDELIFAFRNPKEVNLLIHSYVAVRDIHIAVNSGNQECPAAG